MKVGGEWNFDETEENVGGFSVYGEYEKGPVKVGGEWDFDEEGDDENVGFCVANSDCGPASFGNTCQWNRCTIRFDEMFDEEEDESVGYGDDRQVSSVLGTIIHPCWPRCDRY